jgi:hypothetical protein
VRCDVVKNTTGWASRLPQREAVVHCSGMRLRLGPDIPSSLPAWVSLGRGEVRTTAQCATTHRGSLRRRPGGPGTSGWRGLSEADSESSLIPSPSRRLSLVLSPSGPESHWQRKPTRVQCGSQAFREAVTELYR